MYKLSECFINQISINILGTTHNVHLEPWSSSPLGKDYIYRHICHFSSVVIALIKCKFWFGVTLMAMAHICHRCHSWCTIYRRRTKNVNSRLFLYFFARTGALYPKWWTISYATMWHIFQRFNHKRLLNKNFYGTSLTTKLQSNCSNRFFRLTVMSCFA